MIEHADLVGKAAEGIACVDSTDVDGVVCDDALGDPCLLGNELAVDVKFSCQGI